MINHRFGVTRPRLNAFAGRDAINAAYGGLMPVQERPLPERPSTTGGLFHEGSADNVADAWP